MSSSHLYNNNIGSSSNIIKYIQRQDGWTNAPLINENQNGTCIYMPCYVRTKLKNIVSMDPQALKGRLNLTIILSIYYGQFKTLYPQLFQNFENNIVLQFKIDRSIRLVEGFHPYQNEDGQKCSNYVTKKDNQKQKMLNFSIRKMINVPLNCHLFWSPFQFIQYVTTVIIPSIKFREEYITIKFNMMNISPKQPIQIVASYTQQGALGQYDLAQNLIKAKFTNQRFYSNKQFKAQNLQQNQTFLQYKASLPFGGDSEYSKRKDQQITSFKEENIKPFKFGHFVYPIYRQGLGAFFRLILPLFILGMLNLGIFFQGQRAGKRLLNISVIMVSYVALQPIIRQKLPFNNKLVISEILLFSMASMTLLTLAHSIKLKKDLPAYAWQTLSTPQFWRIIWHQDQIFLAAMIITFVIIAIAIYIGLVYSCFFYRKFNKNASDMKQDIKLNRKEWSNVQCDKYFNKFIENGVKIQTLSQWSQNFSKKDPRKIIMINQQDDQNLFVF